MSKLQDIRNLVQEHAVSVSGSPGDWMDYMDTATLQDALMAVAREMASDNLEEYLNGLEYAVEDTYLEDLDEVTIRSDFRQLATGMYVSVPNRSYEREYCYYSTNSEVYPYLHLYNKGKKESDKYGY